MIIYDHIGYPMLTPSVSKLVVQLVSNKVSRVPGIAKNIKWDHGNTDNVGFNREASPVGATCPQRGRSACCRPKAAPWH